MHIRRDDSLPERRAIEVEKAARCWTSTNGERLVARARRTDMMMTDDYSVENAYSRVAKLVRGLNLVCRALGEYNQIN